MTDQSNQRKRHQLSMNHKYQSMKFPFQFPKHLNNSWKNNSKILQISILIKLLKLLLKRHF